MTHKLKVGQSVVQAYRGMDHTVMYQIVRLMPLCSKGTPQYLIACRIKGLQRLVREAEIKPAFP